MRLLTKPRGSHRRLPHLISADRDEVALLRPPGIVLLEAFRDWGPAGSSGVPISQGSPIGVRLVELEQRPMQNQLDVVVQ